MPRSRTSLGLGLVGVAMLVGILGVGARTSALVLLAVLIFFVALLVIERFPVDRRW